MAVLVATGAFAARPASGWLVESVLFQPTPGADFTPERLGIRADDVFLTTTDGVRIHAYDLPDPRPTSPDRSPRAVLFLHGNAGNASHRLPNAAALADLGVRVLLVDYRGYGRSEGRASIPGVVLDAEAALAYLAAQGIPNERVVVFGRSLGGAVAVQMVKKRPLAGLILESTFTSLSDMGRDAFGSLLGGAAAWLASGLLDSKTAIADLRAPLLSLHGDRDRIVPFEQGRALYESAPGHKRFEVIRGAGHNDTVQVGGRAYFETLRRFIDEVAPP